MAGSTFIISGILFFNIEIVIINFVFYFQWAEEVAGNQVVTMVDNAIIVQTTSTDEIHIENEEENVRKRSYLPPIDPNWDSSPLPKRSKADRLQSLEMRRKQFILSVSAFKCKLCPFLALAIENVEKHLFEDHEDEFLEDGEMWFEIAKKEKIPLQCENCENSFMSMVDFRI